MCFANTRFTKYFRPADTENVIPCCCPCRTFFRRQSFTCLRQALRSDHFGCGVITSTRAIEIFNVESTDSINISDVNSLNQLRDSFATKSCHSKHFLRQLRDNFIPRGNFA